MRVEQEKFAHSQHKCHTGMINFDLTFAKLEQKQIFDKGLALAWKINEVELKLQIHFPRNVFIEVSQ